MRSALSGKIRFEKLNTTANLCRSGPAAGLTPARQPPGDGPRLTRPPESRNSAAPLPDRVGSFRFASLWANRLCRAHKPIAPQPTCQRWPPQLAATQLTNSESSASRACRVSCLPATRSRQGGRSRIAPLRRTRHARRTGENVQTCQARRCGGNSRNAGDIGPCPQTRREVFAITASTLNNCLGSVRFEANLPRTPPPNGNSRNQFSQSALTQKQLFSN